MMKTIINSVLSAAAILALVLSCAREENAPADNGLTTPVTISATIADLTTKVTFDPTYDGTYGKPQSMDLSWADGDKLRIYNHADRSQYSDFDLDPACIGQKTGTFSGSLVAASSWDVEIFNGALDCASQTQPSDGVTTGLKYLASVSDTDDVADLYFTDFSSVLAITAQMPSSAIAAKIKSVDVTASANIFDGGNALTITFDSIGDADTDGILHFFATLPQGDQAIAAGTTLLVKFNAPGETHDVYTRFVTLGARTFTHNKLNTININATNSATYANGSTAGIGTESNPYLIGDKYQMDAMHSLLGNDQTKYFQMVDDIDLASINPWVPLCLEAAENKQIFFDGAGHTISNLTANSTNDYPSFFGFLWGQVHNVVFDHATISSGSSKEQSCGVVSGYIGGSGHQGDCSSVTIKNSSVTSGGGTAYVGGLGARVGKAGEFRNCHVINTTVSTGTDGTCVGGMLSYIASNAVTTISDCSAEDITVTGKGHFAGGLVAQINSSNPVTICRCHTTGTVNRTSSGRHFGGLVGSIYSADVQIINCYSTCSVTGYQFNGGLVGSFYSAGTGIIDHCLASGVISDVGNSGDGGLVGCVNVAGVTITNCIAWNSKIAPKQYAEGNYSTGAVVGRTHPNTNLQNNYRKPGMDLTAYWAPSSSFDHPNSIETAGVYYIWRIGTDLVEANGDYTSAKSFASPNGVWAYHGKHLPNSTTVTPDNNLGWTSNEAIADITEPEDTPENPGYTGTNVWGLGTTTPVVDGVQWTNYHGTWQGKIREINIITTTLNEHNKLKVFYNYTADSGKYYLDEKCNYVTNAVAATNGSMTSQFIRVNDIIKRSGNDANNVWEHNCALTIDGDVVNIVKVENNADASTLPNNTICCAGPLLVWKGNKLTASDEWLAADTNKWLTNGGNSGGQPRTAIGINKEGTKVIQVTVDGRWTGGGDDETAYGMATDELAQLMLELGCYKAMNLDGGGGSQMWVYGKGDIHNIVNHPHNTWPTYDKDALGPYYWIHNNEVARRPACCAVYIQSDLK